MAHTIPTPYHEEARSRTNITSVIQFLVGQHKLTLQAGYLFLFFYEQVNIGHESQWTQEEIAQLTQMSLRTLKKYLDELTVNGFVIREKGVNQHKCTYHTNVLHSAIEEAYQKVFAIQNSNEISFLEACQDEK